MSANVDDMMYRGQIPWHKQGTKVEGAVTTNEVIDKAGLNFSVSKRPIYTVSLEDLFTTSTEGDKATVKPDVKVPETYATVRDDREDVLGVVGSKYNVIQNWDAFQFLDPLVSENPDIEYHTAGALGRGEVIWVVLKDTSEMVVTGDKIDKYLFLRTSHDGSCRLEASMTPVRVVCQNTLNLALGRRTSSTFSVKHTDSAEARMKQASKILKSANDYFETLHETFESFVQQEMKQEEIRQVLEKLFPTNKDGEFSGKAQNDMDKIMDLCVNGSGIDYDIRGTKYAAINGVIEYADHHKTFRVTGDKEPAEARMESILDGSAKRFKDRAFKLITKA